MKRTRWTKRDDALLRDAVALVEKSRGRDHLWRNMQSWWARSKADNRHRSAAALRKRWRRLQQADSDAQDKLPPRQTTIPMRSVEASAEDQPYVWLHKMLDLCRLPSEWSFSSG